MLGCKFDRDGDWTKDELELIDTCWDVNKMENQAIYILRSN